MTRLPLSGAQLAGPNPLGSAHFGVRGPLASSIETDIQHRIHDPFLTRKGGLTPQKQLNTAQANRRQLLDIIGLRQLRNQGGLLGQPLFSDLLGRPIGETTGSVLGNVPGAIGGGGGGGGGGGNIGSPGFRDSPGSPGQPSGGGGLFGDIVRGRGQAAQSILGDISQFGQAGRQRIQRGFENARGSALAGLEQRGIAGSSLLPSTFSGLEEAKQQQLTDLNESLLGQRVGAKTQLSEGLFGALENELARGLQSRGQGLSFLQGIFGSALGAVPNISVG